MAKAEKYRLAQIVECFGGEILGDPQTPISQVATLETANARHISFLTHRKYRKQLADTRAGAVILSRTDSGLTR
jgi:UDP-3-O-[3-hydroxymyristoyl] glucosamine N-acyltransferase